MPGQPLSKRRRGSELLLVMPVEIPAAVDERLNQAEVSRGRWTIPGLPSGERPDRTKRQLHEIHARESPTLDVTAVMLYAGNASPPGLDALKHHRPCVQAASPGRCFHYLSASDPRSGADVTSRC